MALRTAVPPARDVCKACAGCGIDERIARPDDRRASSSRGWRCRSSISKRFAEGHLSPVFFGSALRNFGVAQLLDATGRVGAGAAAAQGAPRTVQPERGGR